MEIPAHILWGVAGFILVSGIKIGYQALKDIDAAHTLIRELRSELNSLRKK